MLLTAALAFALDTKKIPTQDLFLDDGKSKTVSNTFQFAVVGEVRNAAAGEAEASKRVATPKVGAAIRADISGVIQQGKLELVVLMGNLVTSSTAAAWKGFTKEWSLVLAGSEPPENGQMRARSLVVAGADDGKGDDRYAGLGAAFPGTGQDIGLGRVATWQASDVKVDGHRWRFVVLDSNKALLGSRWDEQLAWLEGSLKETESYDSLLVFMHHPLITLATGQPSNAGDAPSELLAVIDDVTKIGALKAIFSSGSRANEVYLPRGKFGELYVVAGGGGAPADTLERWGHAKAAGFDDVKLETTYDFALLREFERQFEARGCAASAMDHAKSANTWAGFPGAYEASCMPVQGWWDVSLTGERMQLNYRHVQPDGTLKGIYSADFAGKKAGWTIGK